MCIRDRLKNRTISSGHYIWDSVRGFGDNELSSHSTNVEGTNAAYYTVTKNATGFDITQTGGGNEVNYLNYAHVAWNWKANGAGVSNTNGTITSTVSANADAGFSIVSYTGTGSAATVGHGLSVAPEFVITKKRNATSNWATNDPSRTNNGFDGAMVFTTAAFTVSSAVWNNTSPTSSVFSIGTADATNASSSATYIAYCFHSVEGYSKVGSYTGNGSTDGTFVHCGFRPAMIILKRTDSAVGWMIVDNKRDPFNVADARLNPNSSGSEATNVDFADYLSNGFKLRTSDGGFNASGGTYIFLAFAETDFKNTNAR
jgi:hypothetical protein